MRIQVRSGRRGFVSTSRRQSRFTETWRQRASEQSVRTRRKKAASEATSERRELQSRLALNLEILRRCLALIGDLFVLDDLPLVQTAEAGLLDRRDMDKHIFSARLGLNKSVALLRIEPLYGAARH